MDPYSTIRGVGNPIRGPLSAPLVLLGELFAQSVDLPPPPPVVQKRVAPIAADERAFFVLDHALHEVAISLLCLPVNRVVAQYVATYRHSINQSMNR